MNLIMQQGRTEVSFDLYLDISIDEVKKDGLHVSRTTDVPHYKCYGKILGGGGQNYSSWGFSSHFQPDL